MFFVQSCQSSWNFTQPSPDLLKFRQGIGLISTSIHKVFRRMKPHWFLGAGYFCYKYQNIIFVYSRTILCKRMHSDPNLLNPNLT